MRILELAGGLLLGFGVASALVAGWGLLRCARAAARIHVMSIGAVGALLPCLLGAALIIGDAGALLRAGVASLLAVLLAPLLGQVLLLRAVVDGEVPDPEAAEAPLSGGDGGASDRESGVDHRGGPPPEGGP